jgi:tRNA (guanine-N7-)-methyltransferase
MNERHERAPSAPIEKEFGVPIPGEVLPQDRWVRTALKKVPDGLLDWEALFGRRAPLVIDIGCGNGRYTLQSAVQRPQCDHLAVDILPMVIRYATRRANQRGLSNTRWAVIGGRELLADHVPAGSVAEIHCYHPQPYYTREEVPKRLITGEFLALAHRALVPGGLLFLQTDHPAYWDYMLRVVPVFFELAEHVGPWPDSPRGRTRREIIARSKRLPVFRGMGRARLELDMNEARRLAEQLPLPTFDADRRLVEVDRLERDTVGRPGAAATRRSAPRNTPRRKARR